MRTKIDYGIDLGTTNSAIARMENGAPVIKKSDTLKDTIPSCVSFNKKQDILVGDPAYNVLKNDKIRSLKSGKSESSNSFIEFKRTMGTNTRYHSSNMNFDYSSEQLSAEVLMKLKSFITDDSIKSIVITVPAKFTMVQKEATVRAGQLAGFQHIELLQEPIAASMAYGLDSTNKDGIWLVFDFGGGTFDAALIKVEEGIMKVVDTEGDNWLGGKNLDEAIVDQIIIPYMEENYAIDSILEDMDKREILRGAVKSYAEECKIQMSFKDAHNILTDLGDLPFEDENGDEPSLDINVNQASMEVVVSPIFQKAIDTCKHLLKRNNLKGAQLTTLLLVGGPTYSPILRRMLKEQITDKVNTSTDPMTSVAKGAALFASTIDISEAIVEESRDKTKIQLDIKYEPTTVEIDEMVSLKILREKTTGRIPEKIFAEITRGDKAWSSGKKAVGEKATLIDVQLNTGASNTFVVVLYDDQGNKLDCEPSSFNILQGINPGQAVLPYHIGIEIKDRVLEEDVFLHIKGLEKNQTLPAIGVTTGLKTQRPIRPGMIDDFIVIPIFQGEHGADGTRAIYNEHVNDVIITGESLPALLPAGSEVEITVKVDRSEQMTFSAFFPYLNYTEEIPVKLVQKSQVDEDWLKDELRKAKKTANRVKESHPEAPTEPILKTLDEMENQLNNEKGSADGKFRILENLRKDLRLLDGLERQTEWPKAEQELKDAFYELEDLLSKIKANSDGSDLNMDKINLHLQEFRQKTEQVIKTKDIKAAKELSTAISQFDFELRNLVTGGGMDIAVLQQISENFSSFHWKDRVKARTLCNHGLQLVQSGKTGQVRPVLVELVGQMDHGEAEEFLGKLTR